MLDKNVMTLTLKTIHEHEKAAYMGKLRTLMTAFDDGSLTATMAEMHESLPVSIGLTADLFEVIKGEGLDPNKVFLVLSVKEVNGVILPTPADMCKHISKSLYEACASSFTDIVTPTFITKQLKDGTYEIKTPDEHYATIAKVTNYMYKDGALIIVVQDVDAPIIDVPMEKQEVTLDEFIASCEAIGVSETIDMVKAHAPEFESLDSYIRAYFAREASQK